MTSPSSSRDLENSRSLLRRLDSQLTLLLQVGTAARSEDDVGTDVEVASDVEVETDVRCEEVGVFNLQ